jgi:hypothetical protein
MVTNNYFIGGQANIAFINVTNATVTGNKVYAPFNGAHYTRVYPGHSYAWNNNTYWGAAGRNVYALEPPLTGAYSFTSWKSQTGFDANSSDTSGMMPDTVVIRANSYQAGRCNVMIYAPSGPAAINVNLSTCGLTNGQRYSIKNAFNWFGPNVVSGTYNSNSPMISVPLNGAAVTVAEPIGHGYTPPTTCPKFCPMIIVPD